MATAKKKSWVRFLIPGFIFQSVTIGGGYGTGAEIAQYFGTSGLVGGLCGMAVTVVIWSALCALAFEFTRLFKTYDYGSLMKGLLGKFSWLYDICYYLMMFIVLGVLYATASTMFASLTGLSGWIGIAILFVGVFVLVMTGTAAIEKVLSFWSIVLYAVYIAFLIAVFANFSGNIAGEFAAGITTDTWLGNGATYAFYNLVVVPLILYTVRDCETRQEAVVSGVLAGILGIIPGILLLLAMCCNLPAVVAADAPVTVIFDMLNMPALYIIFEIVLFGTLIETGTGFVKAVSDRLEIVLNRQAGRAETPSWLRAGITVGVIIIGVGISTFGLFNLIVQGYGTACYGFLILFAIPMVFVGLYKIGRYDGEHKNDK